MKIVLVCNAGMSTGIMQVKIEEEAKKRGIADISVVAAPMTELNDYTPGATVVALGPQVRFAESDIRDQVDPAIPVFTISSQDFGLMRADKVLDYIEELVDKA